MARLWKTVLSAVCLGLLILLLWNIFLIQADYQHTAFGIERYFSLQEASQAMHLASERLTHYAKSYVDTQNPTYVHEYLKDVYDTQSREATLKILYDSKYPKPPGSDNMLRALELSDNLAKKEMYALRLTAEAAKHDLNAMPMLLKQVRLISPDINLTDKERIQRARELLFSPSYDAEQREIMAAIHQFTQTGSGIILAQVQDEMKELDVLLTEEKILAAVVLAGMIFLVYLVLRGNRGRAEPNAET